MEQLANFGAVTTLNMPGGLDAVSTTLTLTSTGSPFPSSFPFRIRIDDELMMVSATPGTNQWTVTRGDGGTTAATHLDSANVRVVLTKEAMDAILSIQSNGTETSNRRTLNFSTDFTVTDDSTNKKATVALASGVTGLKIIASGTFNWTVSGNSHSEQWSLSGLGITKNMASLYPIVRIMQPAGSTTALDGNPNYTSGECWAVGEIAFGRTDLATTGVPDTLNAHFGKIVSVSASGYKVYGEWTILG